MPQTVSAPAAGTPDIRPLPGMTLNDLNGEAA